MKRIIGVISIAAVIHFALMFFTTARTVDHNLSRTFDMPRPNTWLTDVTLRASAVLRQPLEFFLDLFPRYSEPKVDTTTDQMLGWLCHAINSILWGTVIGLSWYAYGSRFHGHQTSMSMSDCLRSTGS
jgi:hypothetical protein